MKNCRFIVSLISLSLTVAAQAEEKSISGIVTTRLVQPDGAVAAFVLVDPARPTVAVTASGTDAAALAPRNQVTLSGAPAARQTSPSNPCRSRQRPSRMRPPAPAITCNWPA